MKKLVPIYEYVDWASAVKIGNGVTSYQNIGVSLELLASQGKQQTIAARLGLKLMQSNKKSMSDVLISAFGIGYEFQTSHIIDVGLEHRQFNGIEKSINSFSISYAWQSVR